MGARYQGVVQFPGTREQVIAASQEAARRSGLRVTAADPATGTVHAETRVSMSSWGEKVTVYVDAYNQVSVTSQCLLPTQLIDWGKNKRNVNRFFGHLTALLQPSAFPPPAPPPAQFPPR
jgi:hypothetical protein